MKAGKTVTIRVNPKDAISVLDLMNKVEINTSAMSYSQCVSLALASLLESARKNGALPEPDPFDFLNRMQPFSATPQARKLAATNAIYSIGSEFKAPVLDVTPQSVEYPSARERLGVSQEEEDRMWARAGELQGKANLTVAERLELEELVQKL